MCENHHHDFRMMYEEYSILMYEDSGGGEPAQLSLINCMHHFTKLL